MTEDEFRNGPKDEDILDVTVPAGVPGVLFGAIRDTLERHYKPGTTIVTKDGARVRAGNAAVAVLETTMSFYEAVARQEGGDE